MSDLASPLSGLGALGLAQAALDGKEIHAGADTLLDRFIQSLSSSGAGDRAVLTRHLLRRTAMRDQAAHPSLLVPTGKGWPSLSDWGVYGCIAAPIGDRIRVSAQAWSPRWISGTSDPAAEAFAETPRRDFGAHASGDPFLSTLGHTDYLAGGQREAVRAALTSPPGATLLVVLPTGAGKTTVIHALAAADRRPGTVVVVVPTVALAIDQDRRARDYVGHPTAYVGARTEADTARNGQILKRLRDGSQRIMFAAPEALTGLLGRVTVEAAEAGFFRALVVDEAHLAAAWGDSFRPAFQDLSGLRQQLLNASPSIPTVLLSATVTAATRETLRAFFSGPGPFRTLAALQLRPEPSYTIVAAPDEDTRVARVLDALAHLPRPAIVYVTRRQHVRDWRMRLAEAGYRRFETLAGDDSAQHRRHVLNAWQRGTVDLVVGTSAFGLGVDQKDVRTVIHACLPESVDRFYQEVGRGGRDGCASVSLLVHTPGDHRLAERLARQSMVSAEMAHSRWQAMFASAESLGDDRYRISLDAERKLDIDGDYNRAWNHRTLNLMTRSRLLALDGDSAEQYDPGHEDSDASPVPTRVVQVLDYRFDQPEVWDTAVSKARSTIKADSRHNLAVMQRLLTGSTCIAEALAEVYDLPRVDEDRGAHVARACGGCAAHAAPISTRPLPVPRSPWSTMQTDTGALRGAAQALMPASGPPFVVFYPSSVYYGQLRDLTRAVAWCIRHGVGALAAPARIVDAVLLEVGTLANPIFSDPTFDALRSPACPTVIVVPPGEAIPPVGERPVVLFAPNDAPDPNRSDRKAFNVWNGPHNSLAAFRVQHSL